jgi:hypothetical protein
MSEGSPVKIKHNEWPIIAHGSTHDGAVECQANTEWYIAVRQHADGRRLVYGWQCAGSGGKPVGYRGRRAGYLIEVDTQVASPGNKVVWWEDMRRASERRDTEIEEQTVRAIRRVAGVIGDDELGDECIGDLPAREI